MAHNDIFSALAYQDQGFDPRKLYDCCHTLAFTHIIRIVLHILGASEPPRCYLPETQGADFAWVQRYSRADGRTVDMLTLVVSTHIPEINQLVYARHFLTAEEGKDLHICSDDSQDLLSTATSSPSGSLPTILSCTIYNDIV